MFQEPDAEPENVPLLSDVPTSCWSCSAPLCLRQQVINLALGNVQEVFCLPCLGKQNQSSALDVLNSFKPYIEGRECFAKPWRLYLHEGYCPNPKGCYPQDCFTRL